MSKLIASEQAVQALSLSQQRDAESRLFGEIPVVDRENKIMRMIKQRNGNPYRDERKAKASEREAWATAQSGCSRHRKVS